MKKNDEEVATASKEEEEEEVEIPKLTWPVAVGTLVIITVVRFTPTRLRSHFHLNIRSLF